jgi:hypothetical protein
MELDVRLNSASLSLPIENPFRLDMVSIEQKISAFLSSHEAEAHDLDLAVLLPRMVKGIAGCEAGCPADAMSVVRKGHPRFTLNYIEGGILSATTNVGPGKTLSLKLFPEF